MKVTSFQRRRIVLVLLFLAVVGALLRHWADKPSLVHDLGTVLLVLWMPVIGTVVASVRGFLWPPRASQFLPGSPFIGHLLVELTPVASHLRNGVTPAALQTSGCTLILGTEGFSARLPIPLAAWLAAGQAQTVELEFLRPALALPRFPVAARFRVLAGQALLGEGRVLQVLPPVLPPRE